MLTRYYRFPALKRDLNGKKIRCGISVYDHVRYNIVFLLVLGSVPALALLDRCRQQSSERKCRGKKNMHRYNDGLKKCTLRPKCKKLRLYKYLFICFTDYFCMFYRKLLINYYCARKREVPCLACWYWV